MTFVLAIYLTLVYLLFFKFKWLPWNVATKLLTLLVGVVVLMAFLVGLRTLTPQSTQAAVTARIVEIAPQVSGRVDKVLAERNVTVEEGAILFTIDPTRYQAMVDQLEAQLELARRRLEQFEELAAADAGSQFQLEQAQADTRRLKASLDSAQFDLDNTKVRAPSKGMVPRMFLKEGLQVSPSKSVLSFIDTSELLVGALFQQKALQNVKIGDSAMINFAALPGQVFKAKVAIIPSATGDVQLLASGQLPTTQVQRMSRLYPVYFELPDDFPDNMTKVGLAAKVYIHTEGAGVVKPVAIASQWMATSLDAIL